MNPEIVNKIINKLSTQLDNSCEITLEANPTSFEIKKFNDFKAAGINRVSIGIQSLIEEDLKFLGREHSSLEAKKSIEAASKIFDNYSIDLIYARPNQTIELWEEELSEALSYANNHISLYQLTIEKGTPFFSMYQKKEFDMPTNELAASMYEFTNSFLDKKGLKQYEISNYAIPGFESKHNLCYWQYDEFLGIGPGAHSRIKYDKSPYYSSLMMYHKPQKWLNEVLSNSNPIQQNIKLNLEDSAKEFIIMGLRLNSGINFMDFKRKFGENIIEFLNLDRIKYFVDNNLLQYENNIIKIKQSGRLLLNYIITGIMKT